MDEGRGMSVCGGWGSVEWGEGGRMCVYGDEGVGRDGRGLWGRLGAALPHAGAEDAECTFATAFLHKLQKSDEVWSLWLQCLAATRGVPELLSPTTKTPTYLHLRLCKLQSLVVEQFMHTTMKGTLRDPHLSAGSGKVQMSLRGGRKADASKPKQKALKQVQQLANTVQITATEAACSTEQPWQH